MAKQLKGSRKNKEMTVWNSTSILIDTPRTVKKKPVSDAHLRAEARPWCAMGIKALATRWPDGDVQ